MQNFDFTEYIDNYDKIGGVKSVLVHGNPCLCPDPYISIVIPTFRRSDLLKYALESALNQSDSACSYEVIVVDNEYIHFGSSDTKELIVSYQNAKLLYYQNEENLGMVGNLNRCIQLARGKWVSFLHDDDVLVPEYLNRVMSLINGKKHAEGIMSRIDLIDEHYEKNEPNIEHRGTLRSYLAMRIKRDKLMRLYQLDSIIMLSNKYGAPTCGSIFLKESLLAIGGFDDSLYPSFDWFFFYRYCKKYRLYKSMEVLGLYRISVNVSLTDETKSAFIRDRIAFMRTVSRKTRVGRLIKSIFENEQNILILSNKFTDFPDKEASEYFEEYEVKERRVRSTVFRKLLWAYWQIRERLPLVFG